MLMSPKSLSFYLYGNIILVLIPLKFLFDTQTQCIFGNIK